MVFLETIQFAWKYYNLNCLAIANGSASKRLTQPGIDDIQLF